MLKCSNKNVQIEMFQCKLTNAHITKYKCLNIHIWKCLYTDIQMVKYINKNTQILRHKCSITSTNTKKDEDEVHHTSSWVRIRLPISETSSAHKFPKDWKDPTLDIVLYSVVNIHRLCFSGPMNSQVILILTKFGK